MARTVSVQDSIYFTKLCVCLVCTWPPTGHATDWDLVKADLAWCTSSLSVLCLLIGLIHSLFVYASNPIIVTQSITFICACATMLVKSLILRIRRKECQELIDEMEEFVENCEPHEKRMLERYVDKCYLFHGMVSFINYVACIPVILGPFVLPDQKMPTFAVYPFSIDSGWPMYLVFVHQTIVGVQSSAALTIDCQVALMMWFAGARLETLAEEISDASDLKDFRHFVRKHERLLAYAKRVAETMCHVAFTTVCVSGFGSVMCCMQFVGDQPIAIKMQYGPVTVAATGLLMICTWPAENMIRVCNLIGEAMYSTPWTDMPTTVCKDMVMILRHSQQPVQVTVSGFLPALSFNFYCSFLSGVFSYFTTIRIVMMKDDE